MKIGYPCMNYTLGCSTNNTFRLKSYSEKKHIDIIEKNIKSLFNILMFNKEKGFLFFRIGSGIIPFASHDICKLDWGSHFKEKLETIGSFVSREDVRISMHPDQFVVLNSPKEFIVNNSIKELSWHCKFLDLLGLDLSAKVQIHVGGVYGDKQGAIERFIDTHSSLPDNIKKRLVIENDDRSFSLYDCLKINEQTNIPIIFDTLHHQCLNNRESMLEAATAAFKTWDKNDGCPMVDYSTQEFGGRKGKHINSIDIEDFSNFIEITKGLNFDIMLEIKDKEISASKALKLIR